MSRHLYRASTISRHSHSTYPVSYRIIALCSDCRTRFPRPTCPNPATQGPTRGPGGQRHGRRRNGGAPAHRRVEVEQGPRSHAVSATPPAACTAVLLQDRRAAMPCSAAPARPPWLAFRRRRAEPTVRAPAGISRGGQTQRRAQGDRMAGSTHRATALGANPIAQRPLAEPTQPRPARDRVAGRTSRWPGSLRSAGRWRCAPPPITSSPSPIHSPRWRWKRIPASPALPQSRRVPMYETTSRTTKWARGP
jgi:hypothetical protein